jgi:hypothetical protein
MNLDRPPLRHGDHYGSPGPLGKPRASDAHPFPVQSGPPAEDGRCSDPILLAAGGGVPARMSRRPMATQLWLLIGSSDRFGAVTGNGLAARL